MEEIHLMDWEEWDKLSYSLPVYQVASYLRDFRRVKGAGVRLLQFLLMPRQSRHHIAYDFFAQHSLIHLMIDLKPVSVCLIRCQRKYSVESKQPEFEYHYVDYPVSDFLQILEDLQAIDLPHPLKHLVYPMSDDGTDYEFAYNTTTEPVRAPQAIHIRYHWCSSPSAELVPLAKYWEALLPKLDKLLDA